MLLSLSYNAAVQSSALQFFVLPHIVAEHKYALFVCLLPPSQWESYGCFSKRLQRAHKHIVHTRRLLTSVRSTVVPCMVEHANERSGPSTSISPSNSRDTRLMQLYEQTIKAPERKNSSRCINLKALEKVKPLSLFSKHSTSGMHCSNACKWTKQSVTVVAAFCYIRESHCV